jgi:hypothetical protein
VGLHGLVVVVAVADMAPVREGQEASELIEGLAPIELAANAPAERLVREPAQGVQRAQERRPRETGGGRPQTNGGWKRGWLGTRR